MEQVLEFLIALLYAYCLCHAIFSDVRKLRVPNWIPVALVFGFFTYAALSANEINLPTRLLSVSIIFCVTFFFFYKRLLGGGDVKLLSAVSLWIAPTDIFVFIVLMALIGAVLALSLLLMRQYFRSDEFLEQAKIPQSVRRWIRAGIFPYGVAIGLAGLIMLPRIFG